MSLRLLTIISSFSFIALTQAQQPTITLASLPLDPVSSGVLPLASSKIQDLITSIAGTSTSLTPSQFTQIAKDIASFERTFAPTAFTQNPYSIFSIATLPASLRDNLGSAIAAAELESTALPPLESLVSGQAFSSDLVAAVTARYEAAAQQTSAIASIVRSDLGISPGAGAGSNRGSLTNGGAALGEVRSAGILVVGAALALVVGAVNVAML